MAGLTARLAELNPAAPVHRVMHGEIEPALLLEPGLVNAAGRAAEPWRWPAHPRPAGAVRLGGKPSARHDPCIRAFSLAFDEPLSWAGVQSALQTLLGRHAASLLRIKALLDLRGRDRPVVLHAVRHVPYPPAELPAWPEGERASRFVFITADLDEDLVAALLADFTQTIAGVQAPQAGRDSP